MNAAQNSQRLCGGGGAADSGGGGRKGRGEVRQWFSELLSCCCYLSEDFSKTTKLKKIKNMVSLGSFWDFEATTHWFFAFWKLTQHNTYRRSTSAAFYRAMNWHPNENMAAYYRWHSLSAFPRSLLCWRRHCWNISDRSTASWTRRGWGAPRCRTVTSVPRIRLLSGRQRAEGRGGALCAIPNLIIPGAENILRLIDGLIKLKFSRKGTNYSLQYKTDFAQHWHVTDLSDLKKLTLG